MSDRNERAGARGDVASAVAVVLFRAGYAVALHGGSARRREGVMKALAAFCVPELE